MLTAEVKNKSCLEDSLDLYVAGESLSGDNKYNHDGELVEIAKKVLATRFSTEELACVATLLAPLAALPNAQRSAQILERLAVRQLRIETDAKPQSRLARGAPSTARHRIAAAWNCGSNRRRARH